MSYGRVARQRWLWTSRVKNTGSSGAKQSSRARRRLRLAARNVAETQHARLTCEGNDDLAKVRNGPIDSEGAWSRFLEQIRDVGRQPIGKSSRNILQSRTRPAACAASWEFSDLMDSLCGAKSCNGWWTRSIIAGRCEWHRTARLGWPGAHATEHHRPERRRAADGSFG